MSGDIVLDFQMKTIDGGIAEIKFLQEKDPERVQLAKSLV